MGEYAPSELVAFGRRVATRLGGKLSGVLGDRAHTYGYHRARAVLPGNDYSVQLPLDRRGPSWAASAVDISLSAKQMKKVTARLAKAARDPEDIGMECVREFYGTLDGRSVYGLTHSSATGPWNWSTADKSHLWHIHISIFRAFCNDRVRLARLEKVLLGESVWAKAVAVVKRAVTGASDGGPSGPWPLVAGRPQFYGVGGVDGVRRVRRGDTTAIKQIQREVGDRPADGRYRASTRVLVARWQRLAGVAPQTGLYGQVDRTTWDAMARR